MARVLQCHGVVIPTRARVFSCITSFSSSRFLFKAQSPPLAPTTFYHDLRVRSWYTSAVIDTCNEEPQLQLFNQRPITRSKDLVTLEYAELNLADKLYEEVGHVRIRPHVNPLTAANSVPAQIPNWNEVFTDARLPLMVDIGSGSGRFILWHAKKFADSRNHLGLEIRHKLVKRANVWVKELSLNNIHFMIANATVSFDEIVSSYPGPLIFISILCPDPHFKKKHHKRRVVQKPLIDSFTKHLAPAGQIFIQSDILDVALDMRNQFDAESDAFEHIDALDPDIMCDDDGWLLKNPMGIRTEREIHAEFEGGKVYRRMYQKKKLINLVE